MMIAALGWLTTVVLITQALESPALAAEPSRVRTEAVYDGDHRQDIAEITDPNILKVADATVAMFMMKDLKPTGHESFSYSQDPMSHSMSICPNEKFANQPTPAECSGVLIGPSRVLTAGHCVDQSSCQDSAFVFGYRLGTSELPTSQVYHCSNVTAFSNTDDLDYAIVDLDRAVLDHEPVQLSEDKVRKGDQVFLLSHPAGTPLKYSRAAKVKQTEKTKFTAEIDALGGSSGGAVFSADTFELVGILVSGEDDYVDDIPNKCRHIHNCKRGKCDGEDSTPLTAIPLDQ